VVAAVGAPFPSGGPHGADLLNVDPATGEATSLLQRAGARESFDSPAWWPDQATLLFECIPWDPWVVNLDGSGLRRVAETGADEPSVAWSPDQTQVFVYSGAGSFIVDMASGELTRLSFVQGYGLVVWLAST
jgi:Tol biopolymer transport system component